MPKKQSVTDQSTDKLTNIVGYVSRARNQNIYIAQQHRTPIEGGRGQYESILDMTIRHMTQNVRSYI